jgi:hypothetical protein
VAYYHESLLINQTNVQVMPITPRQKCSVENVICGMFAESDALYRNDLACFSRQTFDTTDQPTP